MTNDRAIEVLKAWDLNYQDEFTAHEFDEAFRMAIKALEQEPVLDKIRAEIESLPIAFMRAGEIQKGALKIIDKYKAESEEEE